MVNQGLAGARDMARVAAFYIRGCDFGDETACNNLGNLYKDDEGV